MPKPIADGSHYIQKSNQDYWLRLNGVWVRMGNIRDEGTGGLVSVPPIVAQGFDMEVVHLDRIKFVPDESGLANDFGFATDIAALDRIRYMGAIPESMGFAVSPISLLRVKQITAAFNLGFVTAAQLKRSIQLEAAFNMGFTMAVSTTAQVVHNISAAFTMGFNETVSIYGVTDLHVAFDMGFSQGSSFTKQLIGVTPGLGFSMSAPTLTLAKMLSAAFDIGFSQSTAITGTLGTKYIPTNTIFTGAATPSAVETTFTYTGGGGAAESNLYDGDITTPAADPDGVSAAATRPTLNGLTGDTRAAYDLGTAKLITGITLYTAPTNGFSASTDFKVQYSDVGLTSGWTDTGVTITVPAGTSQVVSAALNAGSHRYWRIIYVSGGGTRPNNNAWVGELIFGTSYAPWDLGFAMAATLQRIKTLPSPSAMTVGFSMAVALQHFASLTSSQAYGFSMSATLSRTRFLSIAMALGFSDAVSVSHTASGTQTPTAVLTTFTYTGQTPAAAESHLYDGVDSTDAADPTGLQTTTAAAYDLGSAKSITQVRAVNSPRFVSSGNIVYKIQYSDTSLSSGWTDTGVTITMNTTLGSVSTATVSGTHRYWRIIYSSGNIGSNAWLGELQFKA